MPDNNKNDGFDFFGDPAPENAPENAPVNGQQGGNGNAEASAPAGQGRAQGGPSAARRPLPKVLICIVALAAAVAIFFCGFFTYKATLPEGVRSLLWFKEQIDENYYQDVSDEAFWDAALHGAAGVLDSYSGYYTADEYAVEQDSIRGYFEGTGLSFFSGTNKIYRVAINSPAFFAKEAVQGPAVQEGRGAIEAGMYLTGVGASPDAIADTLYTSVAGGYVAQNAVSSELGKYAAGQTVYLRLSVAAGDDTAAETTRIVPVPLQSYTATYLLYAYRAPGAAAGKAMAFVGGEGGLVWQDVSGYVSVDETVPADTAYVRVVEFAGNAGDGFATVAAQYKADGAQKLLLDLRNNGGGELSHLMKIAGYLLRDAQGEAPLLLSAVFKNGTVYKYAAAGNSFGEYFGDSEVYVAANGNTASASEALLGAMISYGTVGYEGVFLTDPDGDGSARTYGKGIMQQFFEDGSTGDVAKLTSAKLYWPNGTCIHGVGVTTADGAAATQGAASNADYGDAELSYIFSQTGA